MKYSDYLLFFAVFIFAACNPVGVDTPVDQKSMDELVIPSGFDFSTTKEINLRFQDPLKTGNQAKYFVYLNSNKVTMDTITWVDDNGNLSLDVIEMVDEDNGLIATRISSSGSFEITANIPSYIDELLIRKNEMGTFSSQIVNVTSGSGVFKSGNMKTSLSEPVDALYTVNGSGKMGTVNPLTGEMQIIENMPDGSWTAALDLENRDLYFIAKTSPYPLYKYNLDTRVFTKQGNVGMGGPRLDYHQGEGLLYFSTRDKLYTIDPENAKVLSSKSITGIHNLGGGDVAFDTDGTIYLCSFSGLYRLEEAGAGFDAIRISGEGLPFNPTSMTFDSNGELWLAHTSPSSLVVMDKVTGGWETRYSNFANDINDLTTLPLDVEDISEKDTDNDGIIDFYDEFPNDAEKASVTYTPSVYGLGSIAYEDLWPAKGDYDFNDLVMNYKFISIANADDKVVELQARFTVKNVGASLHNGFGFKMPLDKAKVESVKGSILSKGIIDLEANGLEAGQDETVIIVFDDAFLNDGETLEIIIELVEPVTFDELGLPPFDPFIFIGGDRGRELHLLGNTPTDLHDPSYFGQDQDASNPSSSLYYQTISHLPWAIHIIHDFTYPLEKSAVNRAYLKFNEWAESGGVNYPDWYKDDNGFRNEIFLDK